MKKIFNILIFSLLFTGKIYAAPQDGKGELKLSYNVAMQFINYIRGGVGFGAKASNNKPMTFYVTIDGSGSYFWYCPHGQCRPGNAKQEMILCEQDYKKECKRFARAKQVRWDNGINPIKGKASKFNEKMTDTEMLAKLTQLGFYGDTKTKEPKKVEKKEETTKKVVKKYELKGERSIALSWEGYEDLIAGTVKFDETDFKGTLKLPLPNNDGSCDGTYSLQEGGKGTWQIACTNNMGAAGTLKWVKDGGVTGIGRDHNDKKVNFTVSKDS